VEDNEADVFLIEEAIAAAQLSVAVHVVRNGEQAIRFFDEADHVPNAPCPVLVILDINLPRKPGYDVLKHMRASAKCGKAHVIAVSTSNSESDRQRMAELGADGYFRKPSEYADFMKLGDMIKRLVTRPS
jgi:two-component system, chemotaxis family, response regulator Rcp1